MKILENVSLDKYTTFHMGGMCKQMYIPESEEELVDLYKNDQSLFKYLLGGGSNLLINDETVFENVICLKKFNENIYFYNDSTVYIGASVRLQKAISEINEHGLGGIEYLFSVPGLVGGAIYMNAGRGKSYDHSISDYIVYVDVLDNGRKKRIKNENCDFGYRYSKFQNAQDLIILGALFRFKIKEKEESQKEKRERIELCKNKQDNSGYNFGTVFCESNKLIMELVKLFSHKKDGVHYSKKTRNWLLNDGNSSYREAMREISKVIKIHKLLSKNCKLEVKIW